ncbi:MAG: NAD(P)H-hydrate dehydratase [Fusobacteriaceae bacterium]|nr:NAD(P)H-hydrate dehydratase [Fusobacteriaceae bacterium]
MLKIVSNAEMRSIEDKVINIGLEQNILMENAGIAVYNLLKSNYEILKKNILILAGPGNNGGDGLVLARKLFADNVNVQVIFMEGTDSYRDAARKNLDLLIKFGISQKNYFEVVDFEEYLKEFDLIVDGIFGTGLNKEINEKMSEVINILNKSKKEIISIDIPSGINGDTGEVMGNAVKASKTVVLGRCKIGNILYPGASYCGDIFLNNLTIPPKFADEVKTLVNLPLRYRDREEDSHKGTFKKVFFVGGGKSYFGAPYLNSVSFLKSGGSYANLACPENVASSLALKANEIVFYPLKETREGNISIENLKIIIDIGESKDLMVVGGGFSMEEEPQRLVNIIASKISVPLIIDADGLNALKDKTEILTQRLAPTILTPHLGEMSRLCGKSVEEIKRNSLRIARDFSAKYGVILVLKSARTIIAYPNGKVFINISGNSALSVAGSGDILAGVIAAQFSLGLSIEEAARMGVFIHGLCGDLLRENIGQDGVMAEDILQLLPKTLKYYRENFDEVFKKYSLKMI